MKIQWLFICIWFAYKSEIFVKRQQKSNLRTVKFATTLKDRKPQFISYLKGDPSDVSTHTESGLLLMGGSTDVDEAMAWFLKRSGGGDIVVIRASGSDGYNDYMYNMGNVNSVESIIIDSREKANLPEIELKIRNAEGLFIAGGDQLNYVNYWKNTGINRAINYLANVKKAPMGGTSAGLAILGSIYFSAKKGTVTSDQALKNPYFKAVTLGVNDFISAPYMQNIITDSHYTQRDRQGRHITFLARVLKDYQYAPVKGIGIDEKTAVCINENGIGVVYGQNSAYFLQNNTGGAEICESRIPLNWFQNKQAIKVYKIQGNQTRKGSFNATNWTFGNDTQFYYYVNNGVLMEN